VAAGRESDDAERGFHDVSVNEEIPDIPDDALMLLSEGFCPDCQGPMTPEERHDGENIHASCPSCGWWWSNTATTLQAGRVLPGLPLRWQSRMRVSLAPT
jgi:hypothetical protein